MVKDYISKYESSATNAEIAASASETFFSSGNDRVNVQLHQQSFNYLEVINNNASTNLEIYLDGLATRKRILFPKSVMVIKAEESIYFNTIKITNSSGAAAITAGEIQLLARIMKPE